jgi:hypothetical protein
MINENELPAIKTKVSREQMIYALYRAWLNLLQEAPKIQSILLLAAHGSLETGNYQSMWCYNIGNIKSLKNDGRDFCYYSCNELVKLEYARKLVAESGSAGGAAVITGTKDNALVWVWFHPKHWGCRFRAFKSLEEGAIDYLTFLKNRYAKFPEVWQSIIDANPQLYCHLLRQYGYYTADQTAYTKGVVSLFNEFSKLKIDTDNLPALSEDQANKIANLVALTLQESIDEKQNQS